MWSIAEEINFLSKLSGIRCDGFKHTLVSSKFSYPDEDTAQTIFTFTPPDNFAWIVTHIFFRSLPPINDPSLTVAGTSSGDFRSDDFDVSGLTKSWITVAGSPIVAQNAITSFSFFNKPLLLVFASGKAVAILSQRPALSVAPAQIVHLAVSGYLAPPTAVDCLTNNVTAIEGTFTP